MGRFEEFLGSSEPQSDEFPAYRIGPDGRRIPWIIIYRKPDTPPPEGDRDQRGTLDGGAGAFGPSRAVDAEGRKMSDFRRALNPTLLERITDETWWMKAMARLREAGGYTTRDDEGGSPPVGEFAVDRSRDFAIENPSGSSELVRRGIGDITRGFGNSYGPISNPEEWPAGSRSKTGYEVPGIPAPFAGPSLRPLVAEPAPRLTGTEDFGDKPEFPAGLVPPFPVTQFNAAEGTPAPREPNSYMGVPHALTDDRYSQVSRTPYQGEVTDFSSRPVRPPPRTPVRPNPAPPLRPYSAPRPYDAPRVHPVEVLRGNEVRPDELTDDLQRSLNNKYGLHIYSLQSLQNSPGERAVAIFRAREYKPRNKVLDLEHVLALNEKEVGAYCQKLGDVQTLTDATTAHVRATKPNLSLQAFGTKVHKIIADTVNAPKDPNFVAEISYLPGKPSRDEEKLDRKGVSYGTKNSVRLDVMENIGDKTVCVYDVKTGRRGLSAPRMDVIARVVFKYFPDAERIVVTEIRPRTPAE